LYLLSWSTKQWAESQQLLMHASCLPHLSTEKTWRHNSGLAYTEGLVLVMTSSRQTQVTLLALP